MDIVHHIQKRASGETGGSISQMDHLNDIAHSLVIIFGIPPSLAGVIVDDIGQIKSITLKTNKKLIDFKK